MNWSDPFAEILEDEMPRAIAVISGNADNPQLGGMAAFYDTPYNGILIVASVTGLPASEDKNPGGFYALHIHEYGDCTLPFNKTGAHYNPSGRPHPEHDGDLPPLMGNSGYAWAAFYDMRFTIDEIIGRSIIIHSRRDDFSSQPAGDAGDKIGCGTIVRM